MGGWYRVGGGVWGVGRLGGRERGEPHPAPPGMIPGIRWHRGWETHACALLTILGINGTDHAGGRATGRMATGRGWVGAPHRARAPGSIPGGGG